MAEPVRRGVRRSGAFRCPLHEAVRRAQVKRAPIMTEDDRRFRTPVASPRGHELFPQLCGHRHMTRLVALAANRGHASLLSPCHISPCEAAHFRNAQPHEIQDAKRQPLSRAGLAVDDAPYIFLSQDPFTQTITPALQAQRRARIHVEKSDTQSEGEGGFDRGQLAAACGIRTGQAVEPGLEVIKYHLSQRFGRLAAERGKVRTIGTRSVR